MNINKILKAADIFYNMAIQLLKYASKNGAEQELQAAFSAIRQDGRNIGKEIETAGGTTWIKLYELVPFKESHKEIITYPDFGEVGGGVENLAKIDYDKDKTIDGKYAGVLDEDIGIAAKEEIAGAYIYYIFYMDKVLPGWENGNKSPEQIKSVEFEKILSNTHSSGSADKMADVYVKMLKNRKPKQRQQSEDIEKNFDFEIDTCEIDYSKRQNYIFIALSGKLELHKRLATTPITNYYFIAKVTHDNANNLKNVKVGHFDNLDVYDASGEDLEDDNIKQTLMILINKELDMFWNSAPGNDLQLPENFDDKINVLKDIYGGPVDGHVDVLNDDLVNP